MSRFGNFGRNTTTVNCQITWKKLLALFLMDTCGISALAILVFSYTLTTPWRLVKARQSFRRITFKTKTLLWRLKLSPAWLAPGNLCPEGLFVTPEFLIYVGTCTRKLFKDFAELFYWTGSVHIITILECSSKDRLCWSSICHWFQSKAKKSELVQVFNTQAGYVTAYDVCFPKPRQIYFADKHPPKKNR